MSRQISKISRYKETDLKPCPCCGGKAEFIEVEDTYEAQGVVLPTWHYEIVCTSCHLQTSSICGGNPKTVIDTWNRRVVQKPEAAQTGNDGANEDGKSDEEFLDYLAKKFSKETGQPIYNCTPGYTSAGDFALWMAKQLRGKNDLRKVR